MKNERIEALKVEATQMPRQKDLKAKTPISSDEQLKTVQEIQAEQKLKQKNKI